MRFIINGHQSDHSTLARVDIQNNQSVYAGMCVCVCLRAGMPRATSHIVAVFYAEHGRAQSGFHTFRRDGE